MHKISNNYLQQKLGGALMLFDGEMSELLSFNETGSFIFSHLQNGHDEKSIAVKLVKKYDISQKEALKSVKNFISTLESEKVIIKS